MVGELERIYTVPLREVYISGSHLTRAKRAAKLLRSFVSRHMKAGEGKVKIDNEVNAVIIARGIQKPPRKIKIKAKKDADGKVAVSLLEKKQEPAKAEAKKEEKPVAKPATAKIEEKPVAKAQAAKPEEKVAKPATAKIEEKPLVKPSVARAEETPKTPEPKQ